MRAVSVMATLISLISFPMACIGLVYPQVTGSYGRWKAFFFYLGISLATLIIAALSAPSSGGALENWDLVDWMVGLGAGLSVLIISMKKYIDWSRTGESHSRKDYVRRKRKKLSTAKGKL